MQTTINKNSFVYVDQLLMFGAGIHGWGGLRQRDLLFTLYQVVGGQFVAQKPTVRKSSCTVTVHDLNARSIIERAKALIGDQTIYWTKITAIVNQAVKQTSKKEAQIDVIYRL